MKRIAETLGVARSNLVERVDGKRPKRGPQIRVGDAELTSDIRRLVDSRPSYGYRRIAALLKRERRGWFLDVNYTYARSANFTIVNPVFVHNQIGPLTISGPAVLNTQERVTNQSVTLTLNYKFH